MPHSHAGFRDIAKSRQINIFPIQCIIGVNSSTLLLFPRGQFFLVDVALQHGFYLRLPAETSKWSLVIFYS